MLESPLNLVIKHMWRKKVILYRDSNNQSFVCFFQFRSKESGELETIPEDLEIPLTLASPQHRINIEVTNITVDQVIIFSI